MRYWQVSLRRLSRAAAKLDASGRWLPWSATELSYYRIWKKKIVQRATFDSVKEEAQLLPLLEELPPLESLEQESGFREELWITVEDERLYWNALLGYPLKDEAGRTFSAQLALYRIQTTAKEGLLYSTLPLGALSEEAFRQAQLMQYAVRALYQVLGESSTQEEGISPRVEAAAAYAFRRAMEESTDAGPDSSFQQADFR